MLEPIGRCKLDLEGIVTAMPSLIKEENNNKDGRPFWKHVYSVFGNNQRSDEFKYISGAYDLSFPKPTYWEKDDNRPVETFLKNFNNFIDDVNEFGLVLKIYYRDDMISLVGPNLSSKCLWVLPSRFVDPTEYRNYDSLTGSQRHALLNGSMPNEEHPSSALDKIGSKSSLLSKQILAQSEIDKLKDNINKVKTAQIDELKKLQEEIDKKTKELEEKKQDMLSVLDAKKAEMESMLENMNREIYKLDSEIYAIRCYTGEVLELKKLRTGKVASSDTPLVFFQKMRYLDEELGKIASIYDVDFNDVKSFESLIKYRDDVVDTFLPSTRSLTLIRVSRSNKGYTHKEGTNILDYYEKYHGKKVAILIRDNENVYIAWTDDDRIHFSDDAFFKPGEIELSTEESSYLDKKSFETQETYEKRIKTEEKRFIDESLGRYFICSLMQGILDRNIIKFPQKLNFMDSPYIVRSYADGYLTTNEYGTLEEMIDRCNKSVKIGDYILMTDSIRPQIRRSINGGYIDQTYNNDRGRGEKNRTHDVMAGDNVIYPVNLVEHSARYSYDTWYDRNPNEVENSERRWTDVEYKEFVECDWSRRTWKYKNLKKIEGSDNYSYYISLEKDENWQTGKCARANFEVYDDEFINLTFMNSVWLEYVLTNQKTGSIRIHSQEVDFAHIIPYLKTSLTHVKERERKFAEYIKKHDPSILEDIKWPVKLTEWMIEHDYHNFSEFRAKQFCKSI